MLKWMIAIFILAMAAPDILAGLIGGGIVLLKFIVSFSLPLIMIFGIYLMLKSVF